MSAHLLPGVSRLAGGVPPRGSARAAGLRQHAHALLRRPARVKSLPPDERRCWIVLARLGGSADNDVVVVSGATTPRFRGMARSRPHDPSVSAEHAFGSPRKRTEAHGERADAAGTAARQPLEGTLSAPCWPTSSTARPDRCWKKDYSLVCGYACAARAGQSARHRHRCALGRRAQTDRGIARRGQRNKVIEVKPRGVDKGHAASPLFRAPPRLTRWRPATSSARTCSAEAAPTTTRGPSR